MEAAEQVSDAGAGGFTKAQLEEVLVERPESELREMALRLTRSSESMQSYQEDLQAESSELRQENARLQQTIEMMMLEMRKLHIGGENTVEPKLLEGPLDFAGRLWQKVKPRDTGVVLNEHVGELRKAPQASHADGTPVERRSEVVEKLSGLSAQVSEKLSGHSAQVTEKVTGLAGKLGPLWQSGTQALSQFGQAQPPKKKNRAVRKEKRPSQEAGESRASSSGGSAPASTQIHTPPLGAAAAPSSSQGGLGLGGGASSPSSPTGPPSSPSQSAQQSSASAPKDELEAGVDTEEQISSTVLIEARIKLDDGSIQPLQLRAVDRCKEVAERFVREHSLKQWFQEPLTAYLKQVESDADKYPVKVEADLLEIRKQYSNPESKRKSKGGSEGAE